MKRRIKIRIPALNPFDVPQGHANWKMRKMGVMTSKNGKVSRSTRNRVGSDEV